MIGDAVERYLSRGGEVEQDDNWFLRQTKAKLQAAFGGL